MTNEEAKRILDQHYMLFNEDVKKALDCAIKAIEMSEAIHPRVIIEHTDSEDTTHRGLTLEELKAEAKRQGFALVRKTRKIPHLPCTCGKKGSLWCSPDGYFIQCSHCSQKGMIGNSLNEAWRYWNIEVSR